MPCLVNVPFQPAVVVQATHMHLLSQHANWLRFFKKNTLAGTVLAASMFDGQVAGGSPNCLA